MVRKILSELSGNAPGNLSNFQRMSQARSIKITIAKIENLRFALKAAERRGMDDTSIIYVSFITRVFTLRLPAFLPCIPTHFLCIP